MVRWCWVNFQCRGVLLVWVRVGQGPTGLAVGAGGGCLDIFSLAYHLSFLSPSLWETARYRLKYCLKGPLSPKQPTNQLVQNSRSLQLVDRRLDQVVRCARLLCKIAGSSHGWVNRRLVHPPSTRSIWCYV